MPLPPTASMVLAVYAGWLVAIVSIAFSVLVRTNHKFAKYVADFPPFPLSVWSFTTLVLAIGTYFLVLSQQCGHLVEPKLGFPLFDSFVRTIRCFSAEDDTELITDALLAYFPLISLQRGYLFTNSLIHVAAPVDTLIGIFLLATKLFSVPILRMRARNHDTYVFSCLNDESLHIAQNIIKHYKSSSTAHETENCFVVFSKTGDQEGDALYSEAVTHGMVCLDQPAQAVARYVGDSAARRTYIFSDQSELTNLQDGTRFVRNYVKHRKGRPPKPGMSKPEAYLLSSTPVAENFIDAAAADAVVEASGEHRTLVSVRRADWVRNTIETLLWRMPLFLVTHPDKADADDRSIYQLDRRRVVIVGGGTIGYEFLKAALWCSQIGDVHFTFDLVDVKASTIRQRMAYDAPEVLKYNGPVPEAAYDVNFLGIDALTGPYLDHLREHRSDITYVLIALGDDLANVRVARRTREVLEQSRYASTTSPIRSERPLVAAVVADEALATSVEEMKTGKGNPYDIVTVGSHERIYSFANLFRFELDRLGRNVNRAYWGCYDASMSAQDRDSTASAADAEYERLEYNRRSSRASAIHLKYDLYAYVRRCQRLSMPADVPATTWLLDFYDEHTGKPTALMDVLGLYERYLLEAADGEVAAAASGLEWLSRIEHDRWNAYMRTEGYECADRETFEAFLPATGENQNRLAKQHVCLVPFDELDEVSAFVYAGTQRSRDRDYKFLDDEIVQHVGDIVRDYAE